MREYSVALVDDEMVESSTDRVVHGTSRYTNTITEGRRDSWFINGSKMEQVLFLDQGIVNVLYTRQPE